VGIVPLLLVGVGGFFGAIARYLVGLGAARWLGTGWPWGTFLINVSGCFLIGFVATFTTERAVTHEAWRLLVPVGFIGAYTTFSTFEYEALRLGEVGGAVRALGYVLASVLAGFLAVWAATWAARRL